MVSVIKPRTAQRSMISRPSASSPTRETSRASAPSAHAWQVKLAGAPPSCFPDGSRSHRISPMATISYFFAGDIEKLSVLFFRRLIDHGFGVALDGRDLIRQML